MSETCVDLEKGITGLKEEEKAITGLKEEEEKAVHHYKHRKDMCVKGMLDMYSVLCFVMAMVWALIFYRKTHNWLGFVLLLPLTIWNFWYCHRMKHQYMQHSALASAGGDLSTALLASSKK